MSDSDSIVGLVGTVIVGGVALHAIDKLAAGPRRKKKRGRGYNLF